MKHVAEKDQFVLPEKDGDPSRVSAVQDYITTILRGKWIIAISTFVVFTIVAIWTFQTRPLYESTVMVLIDTKGKQGDVPFLDFTGAAATSKITNELEILKARSTAEGVAKALLEKRYLDEEQNTIIPIILLSVNDTTPADITSLEIITNRVSQSVYFTPVRESDIITITARSQDPHEAAILANTYAHIYTLRNLNTSRVRSRAVREFLQEQLGTRKQALDVTESALQSYMRSSGMVTLDGDSKRVVDQLSQLEASRDGIDVEISTRTKTLTSYKDELTTQEPNVARSIGESNDSYIKLLQEQLARLQVQRDVVVAQNPALIGQQLYTDKISEIDAQIASLRGKLQSRTQTYMKSIIPSVAGEGSAGYLGQLKQKIVQEQIELEGLAARKQALAGVIGDYERQFNQIPQKSIELAKLQRARLSNEKLYLLVEEKYNEAGITEKSEFGYVDLVDPAVVSTQPVSPKKLQNMVFGFLAGLCIGIAIVFVREGLDIHIRTPEDLKKFGYTPLSIISRMDHAIVEQSDRVIPPALYKLDEHLVTVFNPLSPISESFRRLRTSIQFAQVDIPIKTILVTSSAPSEGKTTVAANLAVTFAQTGDRVLIIDTDLRRPRIHSMFGLKKASGLTECLIGKSTMKDVVHRDVVENLDVLCCGTAPPNPAEILGSRRMREFLEQAKGLYDYIIFDSSPVLAVSDAPVLATIVDGTILVVSASITNIHALDRAIEQINFVGARLLGMLLNNFDLIRAYGAYSRSDQYGYYAKEYSHYHNPNSRNRKN